MRKDFQYYYKAVRYLKKNLPLGKVNIRRIKIGRANDGHCRYKNGCFEVAIDRNLDEFYAIEVLLHELAHVISWGKDEDDHGTNWGKAYSLVYRKFLEFHESKK